MTTAVIGIGAIGSVIARLLGSGGEACGLRAPTRSPHERSPRTQWAILGSNQ